MSNPSHLLLQVARGEIPLDVLRSLGIEFRHVGNAVEVSNPRGIVADVTVPDLAAGMIRYASDREELRKWATGILIGTECFDLPDIDDHPAGDMLLGALWDISFGGDLAQEVLDVARALAGE